MQFNLLSGLESRVLFSGTGEGPEPTPDAGVLAADRVQINADVAKAYADVTAANATLTVARQARDGHVKTLAVQVKTLQLVVVADEAAGKKLGQSVEQQTKAILAKWQPVISVEEKDVHTNTDGETLDERAADQAKLDSDRAARLAELKAVQVSTTDRVALETKAKADRAAVDAARKAGEAQAKLDAAAVSVAEKALASVYQTDRKIVEADLAQYRKDGGKVDELHLVLPTLGVTASVVRK